MNQRSIKARLIFLPFVAIAIITVFGYTLLNWLLFIKNTSFAIDGDLINLVIPIFLPLLPISIWLRPCIQLLNLQSTNPKSNPLFLYTFVAWLAMAFPCVLAQQYLVTATGKLTTLDNIGQISGLPQTKYYTAKEFYPNKNLAHLRAVFYVTGKSKTDYNMTIYAPVPIFSKPYPDTNNTALLRKQINAKTLILIDEKPGTLQQLNMLPTDSILTMQYLNPNAVIPKHGIAGEFGALAVTTVDNSAINIAPVAWLAVMYNKTIANHISQQNKDEAYNLFREDCLSDLKKKHFERLSYLERVTDDDDMQNYDNAISEPGDVGGSIGKPILLSPVNDAFANRNGNKLPWAFGSFIIGSIIFFNMLSLRPLREITD